MRGDELRVTAVLPEKAGYHRGNQHTFDVRVPIVSGEGARGKPVLQKKRILYHQAQVTQESEKNLE